MCYSQGPQRRVILPSGRQSSSRETWFRRPSSRKECRPLGVSKKEPIVKDIRSTLELNPLGLSLHFSGILVVLSDLYQQIHFFSMQFYLLGVSRGIFEKHILQVIPSRTLQDPCLQIFPPRNMIISSKPKPAFLRQICMYPTTGSKIIIPWNHSSSANLTALILKTYYSR